MFQIRREMKPLQMERHFAEVELREEEEASDEMLECFDALVHHIEVVLPFHGRLRDAVAQSADVALERRERGAKIMRDARDELFAIVLVADFLRLRALQILPHALEVRARHADLVLRADGKRMV